MMAATMLVSPGQWVTVPVPAGSWPVHMQIGDAAPEAAFVANMQGRRGVETIAKRRCPDLRPGRYRVRVTTGDATIETQLTVV